MSENKAEGNYEAPPTADDGGEELDPLTTNEVATNVSTSDFPGDEERKVPADGKKIIVPRVVHLDYVDHTFDSILEEEEDEDDMNQHYFADQVRWERPRWGKWWFSRCAMIAFATDMHTVVSFPNSVAQNGGIAYILIYSLTLLVFVFPLLYLEVVVGQYYQTGMLGIWGVCPLFTGLGPAIFTTLFSVLSYTPANVLWSMIFLFDSCKSINTGKLPWASCDNLWNTCRCRGIRSEFCPPLPSNVSTYSPSEEYFMGRVLRIYKTEWADPTTIHNISQNGNWTNSYGFNNREEGLGELVFESCCFMSVIYTIILMLTLVDIRYSDLKHKLSILCIWILGYFYTISSTFPILALLLLFFRGVTLEGAREGLVKYFKPDFRIMTDLNIWYRASLSAFLATGACFGSHVSIASFTSLRNNAFSDALTCVLADTLVNIMGCFVGYSFVGYIYTRNHLPIPEQFPGDNFAFLIFPESLTPVAGSSFFAILYYLMVCLFTVDTAMIALQTATYALFEEYKRKYPDHNVTIRIFAFPAVGFAFAVALLSITRGGFWMFEFLNEYSFGVSQFLDICLQSIMFSWIFGVEELCIASETISQKQEHIFTRICWKYVGPLVLLSFLIVAIVKHQWTRPLQIFDSGQTTLPEIMICGNIIEFAPAAMVLVYMFFVYRHKRQRSTSLLQTTMLLISPEFEEERILEDVQSAKRLHWKHYFYLVDPEEEVCTWKRDIRKCWRTCKGLRERWRKWRAARKVKPQKNVAAAHKWDSKGGTGEKDKDESNAWDLWGQINKSSSSTAETSSSKTSVKKGKGGRSGSKARATNLRSQQGKNSVNPVTRPNSQPAPARGPRASLVGGNHRKSMTQDTPTEQATTSRHMTDAQGRGVGKPPIRRK